MPVTYINTRKFYDIFFNPVGEYAVKAIGIENYETSFVFILRDFVKSQGVKLEIDGKVESYTIIFNINTKLVIDKKFLLDCINNIRDKNYVESTVLEYIALLILKNLLASYD